MSRSNNDYAALAVEFAKTFASFRNQLSEALAPLRDYWVANREQIAHALRTFKENLAELPEAIEVASKALAGRGWYIDYEFPVAHLRPILECFNQGQEDQIDTHLCRYFKDALPSLEEHLCSAYPTRATALGQAFGALRNDQHFLAVPVLLAQADGICSEVLGDKLFQKRNGRPRVADKIEALSLDDASGVFLSVLKLPGGVGASEEFRASYPNCLNRHEILHGLDSSYGTEINGWKALSLLSFVGLLARRIVRQDAEEEG